MNIREYVENPMGKGDSSIPNRRELIESLETKYQRLIRNKGNKIIMKAYHTKNKSDDVYFHLIIPSESERANSYDVVFMFSDPSGEHRNELSISGYNVSVFSNSPSFAYTFAYVYEKNGLFIEPLKGKLGKEFFRNAPEMRNRFGIINYEKYVYFGAKYILDSKRLNKAFLDMIARPYQPNLLQRKIRTLDTIMAEYNKAQVSLRRKKNAQQQPEQPDHRSVENRKVIKSKSSSVKVVKKKEVKKPKSNKIRKL